MTAKQRDEIVKAAIAFVGDHWKCSPSTCVVAQRLGASTAAAVYTRRLLRAVAAVKGKK